MRKLRPCEMKAYEWFSYESFFMFGPDEKIFVSKDAPAEMKDSIEAYIDFDGTDRKLFVFDCNLEETDGERPTEYARSRQYMHQAQEMPQMPSD